MVAVAGGRPRGATVNVAVGDGDAATGLGAQHNVLAADERGGDMVDPHHINVVQRDGVASPHVLGVQLRDLDVLDDDILRPADNPKPLALEDTARPDTHNRLVRPDLDGQRRRVVVRHVHRRRVGLVVRAPVVLVDGDLARGVGAPRRAAVRLGRGALGAGEVELLGDVDDAGLVVAEVGDQLVGRRRGDLAAALAAGDTLGEALRCANDIGGDDVEERRDSGRKEQGGLHGGKRLSRRDEQSEYIRE